MRGTSSSSRSPAGDDGSGPPRPTANVLGKLPPTTGIGAAVFTIDEVQVGQKSAFPTAQVYAPTPYPSLRLITCGGNYDRKSHEYLGNTIVYAYLTAEMAGRKALGE